jgi:hypothetical protein
MLHAVREISKVTRNKLDLRHIHVKTGRDTKVGYHEVLEGSTVTLRYGLDGPAIEFRRGAKFSAPTQTDRGAHPTSCKLGTASIFPG